MQNQAVNLYFRLIMQIYESVYIAPRNHIAMAAYKYKQDHFDSSNHMGKWTQMSHSPHV